jgi:hypothetical protein
MNALANESDNTRRPIGSGLWYKKLPRRVSNCTFNVLALRVCGRPSHSNATVPWFLEEEYIEVGKGVEDGVHAHIRARNIQLEDI